MKKEDGNFLKRPELYIALLAAFVRIVLSQKLAIWYYSNQLFDDQLLIKYSGLFEHFQVPDIWSLVKTISYPIILYVINASGLSYSVFLASIWIVAALLAVRVFKMLTNDRFVLTFIYVYILFTPSAFDNWVGTRLYRNVVIAPLVLITFLLMIFILLKLIKKSELSAKEIVFPSIGLGIIFSFTYYIVFI